MTCNELFEIAKQFNALKTDTDRFRFIIEHKDLFTLCLDNDDTWARFSNQAVDGLTEEQKDNLPELNNFYDYLGWSDGVYSLCEAIGIDADSV